MPKKAILPEMYAKALLSYYNIMFKESARSVMEIPNDTLNNLLLFEEELLWRPKIVQLVKKGYSYRHIAERCHLTDGIVRSIHSKYRVIVNS